MIQKIELYLEIPGAIRNRRSRKPARGDIERHMPGMVEPGRERQPDLADDLGPQLQRRGGVAPRRGRQFRPWGLRRTAHWQFLTWQGRAIRPGLYRRTLSIGELSAIGMEAIWFCHPCRRRHRLPPP